MKKKILIFSSVIASFLLIYGGIYLYAWINPKLVINKANSYYFYDINENLITNTNKWITYNDIDKDVINATTSIEDRHFFDHQGFDYLRIGKALYTNIINKENISGASTITQQYAKNLFLEFDKTLERKIKEAWLTVRLETHYTKEEILEGYLNTINYGGIYGIENASMYYFNKSSNDLTIAEASMLAGIPNCPSKYSPLINEEKAKQRQLNVLNSMLRDKYITNEEYENAINEELVYVDSTNEESTSVMYYKDSVLKELESINSVSADSIKTGGLKIYTNLDLKAQEAIESTVNSYVNNDIEVASVLMNPQTGQILGLIGGTNYIDSQFNRATSSNRSVGSTIKPFLYYAALENNFTASTTFTSEKTTFVFSEDETYSPTNYGDSYPNREISLATAIAYSDNIFAVKTHLFLGSETLQETMKRVGVDNLNAIPSLALGSEPISLLDMTSAYSTLASGGYKNKPYFIQKVEDINGNILYEHKDKSELVLNKSITFITNELLANSTNKNFIDYSYPTAYVIANKLTKKYAIKTGTTDYDHLIFGYNNDVVLGVWSGYDDNREITWDDTYNNKQIWADTIEKYMTDKEEHWYEIPDNVVGVMSDAISGKIADSNTKNSTILYYIKGTEPTLDYSLDEVIPTIKEEN